MFSSAELLRGPAELTPAEVCHGIIEGLETELEGIIVSPESVAAYVLALAGLVQRLTSEPTDTVRGDGDVRGSEAPGGRRQTEEGDPALSGPRSLAGNEPVHGTDLAPLPDVQRPALEGNGGEALDEGEAPAAGGEPEA